MTDIFKEYAPHYWAAGLQVIPLYPHAKKPAISSWQTYSARASTEGERDIWLDSFPSGNIGLVLGAASGLVALDVDTDEPKVLKVIEDVFPPSPWVRRGARGYVKLYRYQGQQAFKIKAADGTSICDFLATGQQVVLPPSIHPDTGRPYEANCDLLGDGLLAQIPSLPNNIEEILKDALRVVGIQTQVKGLNRLVDWVPAGGRDNEVVRKAGLMSMIVLRGERTLKEALDQIEQWASDNIEKVWGDDIPAGKASQKLVDYLKKDVFGAQKKPLPANWDDGLSDAEKDALGLGAVSDLNRRFSYEEVRAFFSAQVELGAATANDGAMMTLIEDVCARIATNCDQGGPGAMTTLEVDMLLRYVVSTAGRQVTIAALRKRIAELRQGEIKGTDHSEIARAVLEEIGRTGELRCQHDQLWQWVGSHWKEYPERDIITLVATSYGHYPSSKKHGDHIGIMKVLKSLIRGSLKKNSINGINFVNGYLTEDLELRPHDIDYGCTYVLPYPYNPALGGKATLFMGMLAAYWGDDPDFAQKVEALQQAYAATMFGLSPRFQRCYCVQGVAGSGKTRIIEIIKGLMPAGVSSTLPPTDWGGKFELAEMAGKLINIAGELDETAKIDGAIFKQVVEGAELTAQYKFMSPFQYRPIAAQWFASNHLPTGRDSSDGFARRWLIFRFNKPLDKAVKREADYHERVLLEEREAIAAWAVQGLAGLKAANEYILPPSHAYVVDEMMNKMNSVRFFLASLKEQDKILLGAGEHNETQTTDTSTDHLFTAYRSFCIGSANVSPVGFQSFLSRMEELKDSFGFQVHKYKREGSGTTAVAYRYLTLVARKAA